MLDLAILICRSLEYFQDAYRYEKLYDPADPTIDRIGLQGDAMTVAVCRDNPLLDEDIRLFADQLGLSLIHIFFAEMLLRSIFPLSYTLWA